MFKVFSKNFFRTDLNLSRRWWHRLLLVVFLVSLISTPYAIYQELSSMKEIPQWREVSTLDERITADIQQVSDLKKTGERVQEDGRSYILNMLDNDSLYEDFYCSTELEDRVVEVQSLSGITNLFLARESVTKEEFADYIRANNIKCLIPDAYTGADGTKLRFLEPLGPSQFFGDDLVFYEESLLLTVWYFMQTLLITLAVFFGIAIAYYKVFLYIIFGNPMKTDMFS